MRTLPNIKNILLTYFKILEENHQAGYLQCKHVPVSFKTSESTKNLWKKHDNVLQNIKISEIKPDQTLLDLKTELAFRIFNDAVFVNENAWLIEEINRVTVELNYHM